MEVGNQQLLSRRCLEWPMRKMWVKPERSYKYLQEIKDMQLALNKDKYTFSVSVYKVMSNVELSQIVILRTFQIFLLISELSNIYRTFFLASA